jgi:predicted regulator of Ras-like GTPase activity (Roadblock/LC7/MglB family)
MEVTGITKFSPIRKETEISEDYVNLEKINSEVDEAITPDVERFLHLRDRIEEEKEEKKPMSFDEFIEHLTRKYMLVDATISNKEGLVVASNSKTPEDDAAMAVEMARKVRNIYGGVKEIILGTEGEKRYIFRLPTEEEIIAHLRTKRDLSYPEIRNFKKDIMNFMEGYV